MRGLIHVHVVRGLIKAFMVVQCTILYLDKHLHTTVIVVVLQLSAGSLAGSYWAADRLADDIMIRKFVEGVFYNQLSSDIVIKRKNNLINIVFLISELEESDLTKFYFKVGFSEKLLTELFSCVVTLDAQTRM